MRVLLVSVNRESVPYPVAPLGISYIAGAARSAGHEVEVLDLCFSPDIQGDIDRAILRFVPELIGVSIRNVDNLTFPTSVSYLPEIHTAVAALKWVSRAPMVAGGPGFSIFPEQLLSLLDLEFGIIGEGEETFCLLAKYLGNGGGVPDLPGLIRRGRAIPKETQECCSFIRTQRPARDLLDNGRYLKVGGMANLQTKRGCPFRCAYCTYPQINGPTLRLRPPAAVVDELASMVDGSELNQVFIVDDVFNVPHDHAMAICEEIVARGLRVGWTCFASPLGMNLELASAMKRAGCQGVEFGTDTASPFMLQSMGKPFSQEDIRTASRACRAAGLPDAHYLIFGGPGETPETLAETLAVFDELKPRAVLAFLGVRVYPNTTLHRHAISNGVIAEEDDLLYPRFYISRGVGADTLKASVGSHAEARPNWVVPGLGIRSDPALLAALQRIGHRGPLWNLLESPQSGG